MSEIASTLGLACDFIFGGRTWKVAGRDFEIEGLFEVWVEGAALAAIQRHQSRLTPMEYMLSLGQWQKDCASQTYAWDALECLKTRMSLKGRKYLAVLQIAKASLAPMLEVQNMVEQVFADEKARATLEAALERANADPNLPRPWRQAPAGG